VIYFSSISSFLNTCCFVFRSINYDEKDPFLCNACGFCKYAKFDVTLTAKPCCAVDPIENEEDRKKVGSSVSIKLQHSVATSA
jgi:E3 ubiquitin-protein ligase UBR4